MTIFEEFLVFSESVVYIIVVYISIGLWMRLMKVVRKCLNG